jgi:hypothetical protein
VNFDSERRSRPDPGTLTVSPLRKEPFRRYAIKTEAFMDRYSMSERTSSQIFGLALTAVFVGMLLLNAISH